MLDMLLTLTLVLLPLVPLVLFALLVMLVMLALFELRSEASVVLLQNDQSCIQDRAGILPAASPVLRLCRCHRVWHHRNGTRQYAHIHCKQ